MSVKHSHPHAGGLNRQSEWKHLCRCIMGAEGLYLKMNLGVNVVHIPQGDLNFRECSTSPVHRAPSVSLPAPSNHMTACVTCHLPAQLHLVSPLASPVDGGGFSCRTFCHIVPECESYLPWRPVYVALLDFGPACQFVWQLTAWSCLGGANCKPAQWSSKLSFNLFHSATQANWLQCFSFIMLNIAEYFLPFFAVP